MAAAVITVKIDQRVKVKEKDCLGYVRFIGVTKFATGKWIGVELDEPIGKNDGSVQGQVYFRCAENHGMFVRGNQVEPHNDGAAPAAAAPAAAPEKPATAAAAKAPVKAATTATAAKTSTAASPLKKPVVGAATTAAGLKKPAVGASAAAKAPTTPSRLSTASSRTGSTKSLTLDDSKHAADEEDTSSAHASASASASVAGEDEVDQVDTVSEPLSSPVRPLSHANSTSSVFLHPTMVVKEEDPLKILEAEKLRAELDQMTTYRQRAQDQVVVLQKQLREAQVENRHLAEKFETQIAVLNETVELSKVDKQVAEEKVHDLEDEIQDLTDHVEELSLQVQILQAEAESRGGSPGAASSGSSDDASKTAAFVTLNAKVDRLTQALIKMRDHSAVLSSDNAQLRLSLAEASTSNAALARQLDLKTEALDKLEKQLSVTLERVDASADSEGMIEQLTNQNLALEERVRRLIQELGEVQTLTDTSEAIHDVYKQIESDMEDEIDGLHGEIARLKGMMAQLGKQLQESQETVEMYREKVHNLEDALERAEMAAEERVHAKVENTETKVASLNIKLAESETRERNKALELALHKLEAQQSSQHIGMLKMFLPESFFASDYNGILLMMLLARITEKCDIVKQHIKDEFRVGDELKGILSEDSSLTIEQFGFGTSLTALLEDLAVTSRYLASALKRADVSVFHTVGGFYTELSKRELCLDAIIQRSRGDGLDPSMDLTDLRAAVSHFHSVVNTHVRNAYPAAPLGCLQDAVAIMSGSADVIEIELKRLQTMYEHSGSDGSLDPAFGDVLGRINDISAQDKDIRQLCRKILRRVPKGNDLAMSFGENVRESLEYNAATLRGIASGLAATCASSKAHVHGAVTLRSLNLDTALQLAVYNKIDLSKNGEFAEKARAEGADDALTPIHVVSAVEDALRAVNTILEALTQGEYDKAPEKLEGNAEAPWEALARQTRTILAESLSLPKELAEKVEEVKELKKSLKVKDKELLEKSVLLEAARKRVDSVRHQNEKTVQEMEAKFAAEKREFEEKRKEFEETLDALDEDIRKLETERNQLKKEIEGKRNPFGGLQAGAGAGMGFRAVALQQALFFSQAELSELRGKELREKMTHLPRIDLIQPAREATSNVSSKMLALLKDMQTTNASPLVVDITGKATKTPAAQLLNEEARSVELRSRYQSVRDEILPVLAKETGQSETSFTTFLSPSFVRLMEERKNATRIGKVSIPKAYAPGNKTFRQVYLDPTSFEAVHSALVQ